MKDFITQAVSQFGTIWKRIGVNQRISIVLVAVLIIGGLWAFTSIAGRPDYEPLFTNVSSEDGAAISSHLSESGIPYKIRGTVIYVPAKHRDEVRMDLAAKGLPKSDKLGWNDLFPPGGINKTETEMQINYLRALQGDLASSIESISSIKSAKIHIVLPQDKLFTDDQKPATASVIIGLQPGAVLIEGKVDAIRFLVSKAVEGLEVGNITIVDTTGHLLSKGADPGSTEGLTNGNLKYKKQVENDLAMKAQSMLEKTLGPGKSIVRVTAEIDFTQSTTTDMKTIAGVPSKETISSSKDTDMTVKASGQPGISSNVVTASEGSGSDKESSAAMEMTETIYDTGSKITKTMTNPGAVKRLSVAAFIDKNRGKDGYTETDFEEIIKLAVGYEEKRGDAIKVREIEFVSAPEKVESDSDTRMSVVIGHLLKNLPLAVVIIVLLVFFKQLLKKTKLPEREVPEEFRRATGKAGVPAVMGAGKAGEMSLKEAEELLELPEHETPPMQKLIWKLADEKPEDLAQMLRSWLKD